MTEPHFEFLLDRNPSDWDTRLLYADWLEEQGLNVRANGQRWQARERKCPKLSNMFGLWYWVDLRHFCPGACEWSLFREWIPTNIWKLIPRSSNYAKKETGFKTYHTRKDAEIALAEGLHRRSIVVEMQPAPVEAG